jgi:hypothetical protein
MTLSLYLAYDTLANFLGSITAGLIVVIVPITAALVFVSRLDPTVRQEV